MKCLDEFARALLFVVFVVTDRLCLDAVVLKQLARVPRILARDHGYLPQDVERTMRDIREVSDWRCYQIECAGHGGIIICHFPFVISHLSLKKATASLLLHGK